MPDKNYDAPSLGDARAMVARTLRDPTGDVFPPESLNDFVIEALADLSGFRPVEATEVLTWDPANPLLPQVLTYIWQVEVRNDEAADDVFQAVILPYASPNESPVINGWDFYGGELVLGRVWWNKVRLWAEHLDPTPLTLALYGYRDRRLPTGDDPDEILDLLDGTDQLYLMRYTRWAGFQLLNNDRALYQQWLAATNNTDVSPTQLQGMLAGAAGDVDRMRKRNSLLRRSPVVGPQWM